MRILIFEDTAAKYGDVSKAIRQGGFAHVEIERATNLEDGIRRVREQNEKQEPYNLIITDMWYPKCQGAADEESGDALIQLSHAENWNIPVILCSNIRYRYADILGVVHYSATGDWESKLIALIRQI